MFRNLVPTTLLLAAGLLGATETENFELQILPAPGPVTADGEFKDWDLSGAVFTCSDVENQRDTYGVWLHAMYDADNLYILARWMDLSPMNNPGSIKGDYGFNGDCLQVRVITAPPDKLQDASGAGRDIRGEDDLAGTRTTHITAWRDREGLDTVKLDYGHRFNEGGGEAKDKGAKQGFKAHADGRGYDQEIAIPWAVISRDGWKPVAGTKMVITFEPNFLTKAGSRLTIKDIFRAGVGIDRVFTFGAPGMWGFGSFESKGKVALRPVRLSDGREFPVRLVDGLPSVDWTGLVKSREPEGFKPIRFNLDEDGYVSLNLFRGDGTVARQLLTCAFYTKGEHEVRWDGLGTMSVRIPGQPLEAGEYTWGGIWQPGVTLALRGWAGSTSVAPWGLTWGADHGNPCAVASDGTQVYVGWAAGEGAKPLLACTPNGEVKWKQMRGGIASASLIAADGGQVFVWNQESAYAPRSLYRVDAKLGNYTNWEALKGTDLSMAQIFPGEKDIPDRPDSLCAGKGMVFMGFGARNQVVVVDAVSGNVLRKLAVPKVGDIELGKDGVLYAMSDARKVLAVDPQSGAIKELGTVPLEGRDWVIALAVDADSEIYCGIRGQTDDGNRSYVQVMSKDGKPTRIIGLKQGRRLTGPWQPEGTLNISALAVDGQGQLWITEEDSAPRRVSVWNAKTGKFAAEYFGASTYGALGGGIDPLDPYRMVGQGCEWRLDPKTGHATCLGVINRDGMMTSRYGFGPTGREYLATCPQGGCCSSDRISFFERLGDGNWKLRSAITPGNPGAKPPVPVKAWADENDDGVEQANEVKTYDVDMGGWIQGWYMALTPDLTGYGSMKQVKVASWTKCGAPVYDFSKATPLPGPKDGIYRGGMGAMHNAGSADNRFVLWNGGYGEDHMTLDCYSMETGKQVWSYPSNFTGVHGSHRACSPEVGMIRGAYDICGSVTLPQPIGNIFVIPTNKGEWHVMTEKGYYLTKIFEGDVMKAEFPDKALPGADCTRCPPGAAEEAFGGSVTLGKDGQLSVQGGHSSFWNVEVHGLEKAKALAGGQVTLSAADIDTAKAFRQRYLNLQEGDRKFVIAKATPAFSGDIAKDFAKSVKEFARQDDAKVKAGLAYDDKNLYAGWQVMDGTPWVNSADAPEFLYARGDTVDLQLATDPKAGPGRKEAGIGDLRLSIGSFQGKPTAVLYRRVIADAAKPNQKVFSSGVYKSYPMESVTFPELAITVKPADDKKSYTVEVAIPWTVLGATPAAGLVLHGDIGATHGNKSGDRTALRSYWANLSTGLVSDYVEELMMFPDAWGEIALGK